MDDFKKILLPLLAVFAIIIFVGVLNQKKGIFTAKTPEVKIGETKIRVKIADTEAKRSQGLTGVKTMGENEGMLFVFEKKDITPSFWLKGMVIPIDIIWINDNKVVKIDKNLQPPEADTKDEDLKLYQPKEPIDFVLEVGSGFADKNQIKVGSTYEGY